MTIKKLQQLKAKKGFTLVELIIVIAIIAILAAILIPTMMGYVRTSRYQASDSAAAGFVTAFEAAIAKNATLPKPATLNGGEFTVTPDDYTAPTAVTVAGSGGNFADTSDGSFVSLVADTLSDGKIVPGLATVYFNANGTAVVAVEYIPGGTSGEYDGYYPKPVDEASATTRAAEWNLTTGQTAAHAAA